MKKYIKAIISVLLIAIMLTPCIAFASTANTGNDTETDLAAETDKAVIRVGYIESDSGDENTQNLKNYQHEYLQALTQYTGWEYEEVSGTLDECLNMVESGEIDMLGFIQKTDGRESLEYSKLPMATTNGLLVTTDSADRNSLSITDQYFVTSIDNQKLLTELDVAMEQLRTFYPDFNNDLYNKYFGNANEGKPIFTSAEQAFIKSHQNILVEYDSGWPPIEYLNEETGEYQGVSPDLFALLSEKCGIEFVYEGGTSGTVLSNLKNEDSKNVLTTISYDYEWAETHSVYITQPFISSDIVMLGKNLDVKDPVVAINEKAYFTYVLQDELDGITTKNYDEQAQRLEAVRTGDADYTFVTKDQANYYRSIPKYSSLNMREIPGYEQKICISITKNSDPELLSILSKSLASITHDEMNEIVQNNTVNVYHQTFWDKVYTNRLLIICIAIVLLTLIIAYCLRIKAVHEKQTAINKMNRTKSEFLAHISHDIRTPLNAIIGLSSIAEKEDDQKMVHDYLEKINESSVYLLGLINDTLDVSKIENGKLRMNLEVINFTEIYRVIMAVIEPKTQEKNIDFAIETDDTEMDYFVADIFRLEQIFLNLLNNAVKFTMPGGKIVCKVKAVSVGEDRITHTITISDNGIGMSEEFMSRLYEPFEQEHGRMSIDNSGTGLGLSIVKSVVELMNGTIRCESKKDIGTTFTIEISSKKASEEAILQMLKKNGMAYSTDLSGCRVLLAEDNSMNMLVSTKLLESKEMFVTPASNGKEALRIFESSEIDFFDVILMDIHMPEMNGLVATKAIRQLDRSDAMSIPIIALSANAFAEDKMSSLEAGMNDHLAKPIDPEALFKTLQHLIK